VNDRGGLVELSTQTDPGAIRPEQIGREERLLRIERIVRGCELPGRNGGAVGVGQRLRLLCSDGQAINCRGQTNFQIVPLLRKIVTSGRPIKYGSKVVLQDGVLQRISDEVLSLSPKELIQTLERPAERFTS
jgi:hypothetical protein